MQPRQSGKAAGLAPRATEGITLSLDLKVSSLKLTRTMDGRLGDEGDQWQLNLETGEEGWNSALRSAIRSCIEGSPTFAPLQSHSTYEQYLSMRRFIAWCLQRGSEHPKDVGPLAITAYFHERLRLASVADNCAEKVPSARHLQMEIRAISRIFASDEYAKGVQGALTRVSFMLKRRALMERGSKPAAGLGVSEAIVISLLRSAKQMVEVTSSKVLAARDDYVDLFQSSELESLRLAGLSPKALAKRVRKVIKRDWGGNSLHEDAPGLPLSNWSQVRSAVALVAGAAIFLIAFAAAPRTSEIRRLKAESLQARNGRGGAYHVFVGELSKSGRRHEWIASPMAVAAFEVLRRISEPFRAGASSDFVVASDWNRYVNGRFTGSEIGKATPQTAGAMLRQMKRFVAHASSQFGVEAPSLQLRDGRRFLARFVALRNRNHLAELALQFGHIDTVVTDTYYVGCDREFISMLDAESRREVADALDDLSSGEATYSVAGAHWVAAVKEKARVTSGTLMKDAETRAMLTSGVALGPCDWGYCLYKQESSRCEGGKISPSDERRSPTVCAGCSNFVATKLHREWWKRRAIDLTEASRLGGLPEQTRRLLHVRLDQANDVLKSLDSK